MAMVGNSSGSERLSRLVIQNQNGASAHLELGGREPAPLLSYVSAEHAFFLISSE